MDTFWKSKLSLFAGNGPLYSGHRSRVLLWTLSKSYNGVHNTEILLNFLTVDFSETKWMKREEMMISIRLSYLLEPIKYLDTRLVFGKKYVSRKDIASI